MNIKLKIFIFISFVCAIYFFYKYYQKKQNTTKEGFNNFVRYIDYQEGKPIIRQCQIIQKEGEDLQDGMISCDLVFQGKKMPVNDQQERQLQEQKLQEQKLQEQKLQEQQLQEQKLQEQQLQEQKLLEQQLQEQQQQQQQLQEQQEEEEIEIELQNFATRNEYYTNIQLNANNMKLSSPYLNTCKNYNDTIPFYLKMGFKNKYKVIFELTGDGKKYLTNREILFSRDGKSCLYFQKVPKTSRSNVTYQSADFTFLILRTKIQVPFKPSNTDTFYILNVNSAKSYEDNTKGIYVSPVLIAKKAINDLNQFVQDLGKFYVFCHKPKNTSNNQYNQAFEDLILFKDENGNFQINYDVYIQHMKSNFGSYNSQFQELNCQVFKYFSGVQTSESDNFEFCDVANFPNFDVKIQTNIASYGDKLPVEKLTLTDFGCLQVSYDDVVTLQFGFKRNHFLLRETNFILLVLQTLVDPQHVDTKRFSQFQQLFLQTSIQTNYYTSQPLHDTDPIYGVNLPKSAYFNQNFLNQQFFQSILISRDKQFGFKFDYVFQGTSQTSLPKNVKFFSYKVKDKELDYLCEESQQLNSIQLIADFQVTLQKNRLFLLKFIKMFVMNKNQIYIQQHPSQNINASGEVTSFQQIFYLPKAFQPFANNSYLQKSIYDINLNGQFLNINQYLVQNQQELQAAESINNNFGPDTAQNYSQITINKTAFADEFFTAFKNRLYRNLKF